MKHLLSPGSLEHVKKKDNDSTTVVQLNDNRLAFCFFRAALYGQLAQYTAATVMEALSKNKCVGVAAGIFSAQCFFSGPVTHYLR